MTHPNLNQNPKQKQKSKAAQKKIAITNAFRERIQNRISTFNTTWLALDEKGRKALEDQENKDCNELLLFVRRKLANILPYIAESIFSMPLISVFDQNIQTLATNGQVIFVNPIFFTALTIDEQIFILAHEVWHCLLFHIKRRQQRDLSYWNIAIDHEVNDLLSTHGFTMPEGAVFFPEYQSFSAEKVYDLIVDQSNQAYQLTYVLDQHFTDLDLFAPMDENDRFKDLDFIENAQQAKRVSFDHQEYDLEPTSFEKQANLNDWKKRALSAFKSMKQHGLVPGDVFTEIAQNINEPKVPWQSLLKSFITMSFGGSLSWQKFNRRLLPQGLYLPSIRSKKISVAVAIDTSGSITNHEIGNFINEINHLIHSFGRYDLLFYQCDADIQEMNVYSDREIPFDDREFKAKGRGGTDFRPVFDDLIERKRKGGDVSCLVYFTDGMGTFPSYTPNFPVFWLLTENACCNVSWGMKVQLGRANQEGDHEDDDFFS